ncbi:tRNA threonylcarbamoyladenosine biosynthesis protein TsaB [Phycisphaera mikurensis]|uniref:Gcp-like domain-containing protein n=1 Tax=Phycisphaera mikurensis (strain NBRC 102666 / KCTC 22515 / FYK2301M01) TaxID=1142394 RepID=I0ID85_PHYMF|nr:hypothetical protein [Phycisphaera mikurensis]MBB6442348.1 tRNA threonylcarbamoyladenosine biosynthesis protein TsaB [Phycisphaera mikurensis]BAM03223.1 hypothetical protein PSMK_10640 [Phycisphaera mikurensis NBRC 102666]
MSGAAPENGWGLVIDHGGRGARVGLARGDEALSEARTAPARRHHVDVLHAADGLLRAAGSVPADLAWVGWARGPGSFTGLRVAAATVQVLRLARGARAGVAPLRIAGIPTAEALLAAHPGAAVALAVKRDTAWTAAAGVAPGLRPLAEARALGRPLLADPPHGDAAPVVDLAVLFRLARAAVGAGRCDRPEDARPLYPRQPEAVTIWAQNQPDAT